MGVCSGNSEQRGFISWWPFPGSVCKPVSVDLLPNKPYVQAAYSLGDSPQGRPALRLLNNSLLPIAISISLQGPVKYLQFMPCTLTILQTKRWVSLDFWLSGQKGSKPDAQKMLGSEANSLTISCLVEPLACWWPEYWFYFKNTMNMKILSFFFLFWFLLW